MIDLLSRIFDDEPEQPAEAPKQPPGRTPPSEVGPCPVCRCPFWWESIAEAGLRCAECDPWVGRWQVHRRWDTVEVSSSPPVYEWRLLGNDSYDLDEQGRIWHVAITPSGRVVTDLVARIRLEVAE